MAKRQKKERATVAEPLMTLNDVAAYLQIAPRTVYQWAQHDQLPSFKMGNAWRFSRSDVDAWIEECKRETNKNRK